MRLHIDGDGHPFVLRGEFDRLEIDRFRTAVRAVGAGAVEVDLAGLTFVDSSALRCLLDERLANPGLRYTNPSILLARLAQITGLGVILFEPTRG